MSQRANNDQRRLKAWMQFGLEALGAGVLHAPYLYIFLGSCVAFGVRVGLLRGLQLYDGGGFVAS